MTFLEDDYSPKHSDITKGKSFVIGNDFVVVATTGMILPDEGGERHKRKGKKKNGKKKNGN